MVYDKPLRKRRSLKTAAGIQRPRPLAPKAGFNIARTRYKEGGHE